MTDNITPYIWHLSEVRGCSENARNALALEEVVIND